MSNVHDPRTSTALRDVVLEVGSEGGSLTLLRGLNTSNNWQFWVERNETALYDLLSEDDRSEVGNTSRRLDSSTPFQEALRLFDRYPWFRLYPLKVHPEFLDTVLLEVRKRGGETAESRWREELKRR